MPDQTRNQVNLLDFFAFLLRWRKLILSASFGVAIVVAVITFIVPERFRSAAVVRSQESQGEGIGSLIASKLGSLGGLANMALGASDIPSEVSVAILRSRWMSEKVIEEFDLRKVYKMQGESLDAIIKELLSNTFFEMDDKSTNIIIQVDDKSPTRAKEMVDYYVEQLDLRNSDLRSIAASKEREFIGQRLGEERNRLTALEDSMFRFQLATGVLDIEEQTKATIQAAAALEAQRFTAQAELELNKQVLGAASPETQFTSRKIASIDSTLQILIRSRESSNSDFLLTMQDIPSQGLAYLRLTRDLEIQQLLVAYLLQQFEQARVGELRNTPTLVRIDPGFVPTKRIWPKRGLITLAAFAAAFVFSIAFASLLETTRTASADPSHPQHDKLIRLRESWRKGK